MFRRSTVLRTSLLASLSLFVMGTAFAANKDLKEDSPFLPPGYQTETPVAPPPPKTNGPLAKQLEFKGLINLAGTYRFSVFNKQNQRSYWLTQGDNQDGISISSFDIEGQSVVISMNGRAEQLTLMSASDAPLPVAVSMPQKPRTNTQKPAVLPGLPTNNNNRSSVPPRRRVILPKKK